MQLKEFAGISYYTRCFKYGNADGAVMIYSIAITDYFLGSANFSKKASFTFSVACSWYTNFAPHSRARSESKLCLDLYQSC